MTSELNEIKGKIESLKNQLDKRISQIQALMPNFLKKEYSKIAKNYVERETQISLSLPKEKLSEMKRGVEELENRSNAIANEYFSGNINWWFPEGKEDEYNYRSQLETVKKNFDKQLRLAIGQLGPVLEIYGYVSTKPSSDRSKIDVWCEYNHTGNYHKPGGRPRYPYGLTWPEDIKTAYDSYAEIAKQLHMAHHERMKTEKAIAEKKASDLWDSI